MLKNPPIILLSFMRYSGMAIFPFVLLRARELKENKTLMYHERIHHMQQLEMLIIPFFIIYGLNYLINLLRYKTHDEAYRNIIFEREAFANDGVQYYIRNRKVWAFLKYI